MGKSIYEKQNEQHLLKCIAAQRKEYEKAKISMFLKDFFILAFATLSIVASVLDNDMVTAITFLCAGVISVGGKYIDRYSCKLKSNAAATQQYIDITLYNHVLEDEIAGWGVIPSKSEIAELISNVEDEWLEDARNWYSDYSELEPIEQVFYCQKQNFRWDSTLRKEFALLILMITGLSVMGLLIAMFVCNPSTIKLLCIISWMLPLLDFSYSYWCNLIKDIKRLDILREKFREVDALVSQHEFKILSSDSIKMEQARILLIELQRCIFEHREKNTPIPTWFYKIRQKEHQAREDKISIEVKNISSRGDKR